MIIPRQYDLQNELVKGKVLIIYGARRVGKTTLLKDFLSRTNLKYRYFLGETAQAQELFSDLDEQKLKSLGQSYDLIAIDEAQTIPNIGLGLKVLVDLNPELYVIATGSSSFDLANKAGEPLTGRMRKLTLYPFSLSELKTVYNPYELNENLDNFLIYGTYPEVITAKTTYEKVEFLNLLVENYMLKDIFTLEKIKKSSILINLVKLLAFQIGNLVSLNELSQKLKINLRTVERYLDLLEKSFVIFRLYPLSTNLRKEINRKFKVYFYDNGLRNAVIGQFADLNIRSDIGQVWENFVISEMVKKRTYSRVFFNKYFWRNYAQAEVDYVEEIGGAYFAYEIKYSKKRVLLAKEFIETFKPQKIAVINRENFTEFLL